MVAHGLKIKNYCLADGREGERKREGGGASEQPIYICIKESTVRIITWKKISCLHYILKAMPPLALYADVDAPFLKSCCSDSMAFGLAALCLL